METMEITTTRTLEQYLKQHNVSLRKLSEVTKVGYATLLRYSKAPIAGCIYDPDSFNGAAVEKKLAELNIDYHTLDWSSMATISSDTNILAYTVDSLVSLRGKAICKIVAITASHVAFVELETTTITAWSWPTFMASSPKLQGA